MTWLKYCQTLLRQNAYSPSELCGWNTIGVIMNALEHNDCDGRSVCLRILIIMGYRYECVFCRWVGRQTRWWHRHKAIYFSWFGPELFCLLLGPPGFNCWFSFAPVFQWCCSAPRGSPGVGRNTFPSSPHLCFIIVFICDLFVSRDDPLMS